MKFFSIAFLSLLVCSATAKEKTHLTGQIANAKESKVYLMREVAYAQTDWPVIDSAKIDKEGKFAFRITVDQPLVGAISNSGRVLKIFVSPGDSLHITFDLNHWPASVLFKGKGALENAFYLRYRQEFMGPIPQNKLYGSRPAYYSYLNDSLYGAAGSAFQTAFAEKKANSDFEAFLSQKALYLSAARKMMFPVYQRFVKRPDSIEARVDTTYYSFLRSIPFDNPVAYDTDTYADFLYWYYKARAYDHLNVRSLPENSEQILTTQFDIAASELKGKPLEITLSGVVVKMIDNNYITNAGKMIEIMKQRGLSPEHIMWLDKRYAKYAHLAYGAVAKDFSLPDTAGNMVSLSSLKGKVVYIDVWASWCGPCRKEMPHSRALMDRLKNEPVVFLFVSIDEKPDAWRKALAHEKLQGMHVIDSRGWGSTLTRDYNFNSIPHYILIDQEGRMISADARRPSNGAYEQIKSALESK